MAVPPPSSETPASSDTPASADKQALRRTLRSARRAFVAGPGHAAARATLLARLRPLLAENGAIAGYLARGGEPDIEPFLRDASGLGHETALPHIAAGTMRFAPWHPGAALVRGPVGIDQPAAAGDMAPAVLLVPLLGFDRAGNRLGQGGGFYDRWFAAHPDARRIGIAWSVQECDTLPVDPWDMPVHAIVTEREWILP